MPGGSRPVLTRGAGFVASAKREQLVELAERVVLRRVDRHRLGAGVAVLDAGAVELEEVAAPALEPGLGLVQRVVLGAIHQAGHRRVQALRVLAHPAPAVDPAGRPGRVGPQEQLVALPAFSLVAPDDASAADVLRPDPEEERADRRRKSVAVLLGRRARWGATRRAVRGRARSHRRSGRNHGDKKRPPHAHAATLRRQATGLLTGRELDVDPLAHLPRPGGGRLQSARARRHGARRVLYQSVAQTVELDLPDDVRFREAELVETLYARCFEPAGSEP